MFIEVESHPNCESSIFLRFKELGPSREVTHLKVYDRSPKGEWCEVVGLCDDPHKPVCSAYAQKVEDSGAGHAYVVFGGNWGIRLTPLAISGDRNQEPCIQWEEPYLSLSDGSDLRYKDPLPPNLSSLSI